MNSLQATASCVPQMDTVHGPLKHRTPGDRLVSQATHAHNLVSFFPVGVQIGFEQTTYTAHEGDKSVTVCAVKTAGDIVTLLFFYWRWIISSGYMHTHICAFWKVACRETCAGGRGGRRCVQIHLSVTWLQFLPCLLSRDADSYQTSAEMTLKFSVLPSTFQIMLVDERDFVR